MNDIIDEMLKEHDETMKKKKSICHYWSWDWFDDGEEFQCCLYWWFTKTEIYPDRNPNNPCWEYDDWNCKYFKEKEW